jgi:hypothetical protein
MSSVPAKSDYQLSHDAEFSSDELSETLAADTENAVQLSIKEGWVEQAKRSLGSTVNLKTAASQIGKIIDTINFSVERYSENFDVATKSKAYYSQPIISALKKENGFLSPVISPTLQSIFSDELKLQRYSELIVPANRDDIERVGSSHDLVAMLFWAEIHSIFQRQRKWSASERFDFAVLRESEQHQKRYLGWLKRALADEIHALSANDSTGSRAYYFVHVDRAREIEFLDALNGDGTIDLVNFGTVITSGYEYNFRHQQSVDARARFQKIIDRYAELAKRQRSFSYSESLPLHARVASPFQIRRFEAALRSDGSHSALIDEFVRVAGDGSLLADEDVPAATDALRYKRRLISSAAEILVKAALERRSNLGDLAFTADLLSECSPQHIDEVLTPLRQAVRFIGSDPWAFSRFLLLVCQNRSLTTPDLLVAALHLAAKHKPNFVGSATAGMAVGALLVASGLSGTAIGFSRVLSNVTNAMLGRDVDSKFARAELPDVSSLMRSMLAVDFLIRVAGDEGIDLVSKLEDCVVSSSNQIPVIGSKIESLLLSVESISNNILQDKPIFSGKEAVDRAGIQIEYNISFRLARLSLDERKNKKDDRIWSHIIPNSLIDNILSLSFVSTYIEECDYTSKRQFVRQLLENELARAFDETEYPLEHRGAFLDRLVDQLLRHHQADRAVSETVKLPDVAPATWRDDKQHGDAPPDFIKRHYGTWLRVDGSGLTRPDIKRLDASLYAALAYWLKSNELPQDCPIPKKSEINDLKLAETPPDKDSMTGREFARRYAAQHRRLQKT